MVDGTFALVVFVAKICWLIGQRLLWPAIAFALLALALKGRAALDDARRAAVQTRTTLGLYVFDFFLVGPPLGIAIALIVSTVQQSGVGLLSGATWSALGAPITMVLTLFLGDFSSYWRHRLEHTRWLWPAHAIHHSDEEMTWLTGNRFHPVDSLTTVILDNAFLALLGFPPWAIAVNELVRHYYGEFIHADSPWTYGVLGRVFVSPVMHRWHHARDVQGAGSNFATVFSVFDQAFGTYYVPGRCNVPLGVNDQIGTGVVRSLRYPFVCWFTDLRQAWAARRAVVETDPT